MTGIDVSPHAVAAARERGLNARFLEGDLRALPDLGPFDGVVSWGNSFGYLTPPETVRSLAAFRRLVKPGGRLVLESSTVAESLLAAGIDTHREIEFGGVTMKSTNTYRATESRLESEYVFEATTAPWSTAARRTTSTRPARWCGCCAPPGSSTSSC